MCWIWWSIKAGHSGCCCGNAGRPGAALSRAGLAGGLVCRRAGGDDPAQQRRRTRRHPGGRHRAGPSHGPDHGARPGGHGRRLHHPRHAATAGFLFLPRPGLSGDQYGLGRDSAARRLLHRVRRQHDPRQSHLRYRSNAFRRLHLRASAGWRLGHRYGRERHGLPSGRRQQLHPPSGARGSDRGDEQPSGQGDPVRGNRSSSRPRRGGGISREPRRQYSRADAAGALAARRTIQILTGQMGRRAQWSPRANRLLPHHAGPGDDPRYRLQPASPQRSGAHRRPVAG